MIGGGKRDDGHYLLYLASLLVTAQDLVGEHHWLTGWNDIRKLILESYVELLMVVARRGAWCGTWEFLRRQRFPIPCA